MSESKEITSFSNANELIFNPTAMDSMMVLAKMMAGANATIPKHLKNNVGDCMAIIMQSAQWGMSPWAVSQKTHLVNGTLGFEGQLINAVIVNSGVVTGRFKYEFVGDWSKIQGKVKYVDGKKPDENGEIKKLIYPNWNPIDEAGLGVIVSNTIKGDSQPTVLKVMLTQATVRNSPLWASDTAQQLCYLAVKKWSRLYTPDVILGVYTIDELDTEPREIIINPMPGDEPQTKVDIAALLEKIKTMAIDDFRTVDRDSLTPEQQRQVSEAFRARKAAIREASVVADITPEPEKEPDWTQLLNDATTDAKIADIVNSIPDELMVPTIDKITKAELLTACFKNLTADKQEKYANDFDFVRSTLAS